VVRFRLWLGLVVALCAILAAVLHAQIGDEQEAKSAKSEKTHAEESPAPHPKHTAKKSGTKKTTKQKPKAKKSPTPRRKTKKKAVHPAKTPTPAPKKARPVDAASSPSPAPTPTIPRAIPVISPEERAQVVVEKSGLGEEEEFVPPPPPPPKRFGFWPWSRGRGNEASYRYLTRSVIEQIRRAPVQRRRWQFIVVHNSGTRQGNARVFDYYHRHVRRMRNGLAYHFVIGNGTSTGDGEIEVGDRWRRQINGGHVHSDYLNNISLGICLVGDFNHDQPTQAQLDCCEELIRYLRQRCGKIDSGDILVRPHREMNPPRWPTDCPGDHFPYSWFRRF
jgi:hypothetical protein